MVNAHAQNKLSTQYYLCIVIIGIGNGISPARDQAITWTNALLLLIWCSSTYIIGVWTNLWKFLSQQNAFKDGILKMAAILSSH